MFDALKPLLENGIINENTRQEITEAWEAKLTEAREQIRAELREEMATRYDHDHKIMVEALDRMITENLTTEIQEFRDEKKGLMEDRVKIKNHMMESASRFNDFMVKKLTEEVKELHADRNTQQKNYQLLEKFIVKALSEEIQEFARDKQAVINTRVKLVKEAKNKLQSIQQRFVSGSAKLVKESINKKLNQELGQLREDIQLARENMFGRRIFEAFASEFSLTHLNENIEFNKLRKIIDQQRLDLAQAKSQNQEARSLVESKNREISMIKESQTRNKILDELLETLVKDRRTVMRELLETVQTPKLKSAFEKYLPAVLNSGRSVKDQELMLIEARVGITGDKTARPAAAPGTAVEDTNVVVLRRLAGLK